MTHGGPITNTIEVYWNHPELFALVLGITALVGVGGLVRRWYTRSDLTNNSEAEEA